MQITRTTAGQPPPEWSPGQPPEPGRSPPSGGELHGWLQQRLFDQRIVMVRGHLGNEVAAELAGQLLALDASGTDPVRLHLDSPDGELTAVLTLLDTLDNLAAPVHLTVAGEIGGASLGLLAATGERAAQQHARFRFGEARGELQGKVGELLAQTSQHLQLLDTLIVRLAEATGHPRHRIEDDLTRGGYLTADEAREYGLIDTVNKPRSGSDPDGG